MPGWWPGIDPMPTADVLHRFRGSGRSAPRRWLFPSGRHFAAWIGLTPKDHSTAGKTRLGKITRAGDERLRSLLVAGATAVIQQARRGRGRASPWLLALLKRKTPKLAAVALANKIARIAWIDRSEVRDSPWDPMARKGRWSVWNSRRGKPSWPAVHRPHQQAGHMDASDPIKPQKNSCRTGAVHIWVPALRGSVKNAAPRPGHVGNMLSLPCSDLPVGRFVDRGVESYFCFSENYFCSHSPQITSRTSGIPPHKSNYAEK
jgi:hypothetical protein